MNTTQDVEIRVRFMPDTIEDELWEARAYVKGKPREVRGRGFTPDRAVLKLMSSLWTVPEDCRYLFE